MHPSRILAVVLPISIAAACDPIAGITVRQRLSPAPASNCVRSALTALPLVDNVIPGDLLAGRERGYALSIGLRDSVGRAGVPMPPRLEMIELTPDTMELRLRIDYFGQTTWNLDSAKVGRLINMARPMTRAIHDTCAPSSQPTPICRVDGAGRSRPCAPAI